MLLCTTRKDGMLVLVRAARCDVAVVLGPSIQYVTPLQLYVTMQYTCTVCQSTTTWNIDIWSATQAVAGQHSARRLLLLYSCVHVRLAFHCFFRKVAIHLATITAVESRIAGV